MRVISETFLLIALAASCFFLGYYYQGKICAITQEQKQAFYSDGFNEGAQYANDDIGLVRLTQQDVEGLL